jgi:AmmeMemoRadiSam system protein B
VWPEIFPGTGRLTGEEHYIEVQIPFLQYFQPDLSIVPILVSYEADYERLEGLGQALARAINSLAKMFCWWPVQT